MPPEIVARRVDYSCPWFDVVVKDVRLDEPRGVEQFWSVRTADYVCVLAVTEDGRVPLVRQFRPAVEADVLELPSGAVDGSESPEEAIRRELLEETGCEAGELSVLACLHTDAGRMETRQWAFYAPAVRVREHVPDPQEPLELLFVPVDELGRLVADGSFNLAEHLAPLAVAASRGLISL